MRLAVGSPLMSKSTTGTSCQLLPRYEGSPSYSQSCYQLAHNALHRLAYQQTWANTYSIVPADFPAGCTPSRRSALSERIEIWETIAQMAGGRIIQRFGGARQRS